VGGSEPPWRRLSFAAVRVVESQHVVSTRKLVDSDQEQELLEEMIDRVKPPVPAGMKRLHYLLSTPFRHPPLRWGSRFGARDERGLWYGSRALPTAFAEVAYYRLLFLAATRAALAPLGTELSSFRAPIATRRGLDLSAPPFDRHAAVLASKSSYAATQALGRDMRAAGVDAFLFTSARDPRGGLNVALFVPCFARARPEGLATWTCVATHARVEIASRDLLATKRQRFAFERNTFEVGGRLPVPA
jgi:hypothetical protein